MLAMIGMNMIEIKNPRDEELVGWWSEDDDSVDFDDDMEEVFRCESVPNEDSRGEELRSGAKHCTRLISMGTHHGWHFWAVIRDLDTVCVTGEPQKNWWGPLKP